MTAKALRYVKWGFVFLLFSFNIGRLDLLPDFVGVFLLLQSLKCQEMTETERRLCPLLVILIVDYFLRWIWNFDNTLESLVIAVISTYATYVLLGEIAGRVENTQPERAMSLHSIRIAITILGVLGHLFSEYGNEAFIMWIVIGMVIILFALLRALMKIEPVDKS